MLGGQRLEQISRAVRLEAVGDRRRVESTRNELAVEGRAQVSAVADQAVEALSECPPAFSTKLTFLDTATLPKQPNRITKESCYTHSPLAIPLQRLVRADQPPHSRRQPARDSRTHSLPTPLLPMLYPTRRRRRPLPQSRTRRHSSRVDHLAKGEVRSGATQGTCCSRRRLGCNDGGGDWGLEEVGRERKRAGVVVRGWCGGLERRAILEERPDGKEGRDLVPRAEDERLSEQAHPSIDIEVFVVLADLEAIHPRHLGRLVDDLRRILRRRLPQHLDRRDHPIAYVRRALEISCLEARVGNHRESADLCELVAAIAELADEVEDDVGVAVGVFVRREEAGDKVETILREADLDGCDGDAGVGVDLEGA